ncbi:MAG TPA: TonB-dependent receptor [Bryobacteraceae bacterium]
MMKLAFVSALFAGLLSVPLAAQTSSLQGVVTDPQGGAIPTAILTITNTSTTAARKSVANESGSYNFLQMPPGTYKLEVQSPGFTTKTTEVTLQVNEPLTLNLELALGQTTDVVNVTAEVVQINTTDATVGNPFTETQVKELPLQTRNVVALLSVEPGVSSTGQVLGARPDQNNVKLDGADVNDNQGANGFNAVLPIPLDSVQEFRTTIAGQGADLGHAAGGQVSIVTKSGSNAFHGSLYEFNRNTLFEANDWFSNRAGVPRPALIRNQYGTSIGGPILKNKLFFFFNWEARKDRSAASKTATVPSDSFKQGIIKVLLKSGQTVSLSPADIMAIDPLHLGANSYVMNLMQQYPAGNNPLGAADKGLNLNQLLFNAPSVLNNHAEVARMDYNIDSAGKHTVMVRGTLNGASQTPTAGLAILPGYAPSQQSLDNSRGVAVRYTAVLSPNIVNVVNYGYTRLGQASTGNQNVVPSIGLTTLIPTTRPSARISPTHDITDDLTWTKGRHTIQAGFDYRFNENDRLAYNNLPSYSFSRNTLLGLGADITGDVTSYLQPTYGASVALASTTNVTNAFGTLFALLNSYGATYNFGINGQAIPFGNPITRDFASKSPEFYVQDVFKMKPNLTLTAGLRYSLYGVPYEQNGVEVIPQTSLSEYFAERNGAQLYGIPNSVLPTSMVSYKIGGPVNNAPGYYPLDKKDLAPRIAVAYSPESGSMLEKIMGKGSVLRAGAGLIFDNYGNAMAQGFSTTGSPGLATAVAQPVNTNFTSGFRYTGSGYPTLVAPASGAFPFTPPVIQGGFTRFVGVSSDLKAPYEYLLTANYAKPLAKHMSLEVGYAGRLSHRGIVQQDFGQPLMNFKDPVSGQTLSQAGTILGKMFDSGITAAMVKANPSLVGSQPFFENMFGKAKNQYITGNATANFFYDAYGNYAGSYTDTINDMDRVRLKDGTCDSVFGCNTFFPLQNSGLTSYVNAGKSSYHAMTVVLRRAVSHGWGYDFNYTWSHGIDNGSSSETSGGAALQDAFHPNAYRGPSDFDIRHSISANAVVDIPIGKGKALFGSMPTWLDEFVGGWEVSTLYSFRTGTPINCTAGGVYNVNYLNSALCDVLPGASVPANGFTFDQNGIPNLFKNTSAVSNFVAGYVGTVGIRGVVRGPHFFNDDLAVSKFFRLPKEGMRLQLRGEGYNLLNHPNFNNPTLSIAAPTTFGEITSTSGDPRVLQLALRLEF